VKVLALSLDPYMRNRMRPAGSVGDFPEFDLDRVITGFGVARVLRSEAPSIAAGQHVYGFMPYQQYTVFEALQTSEAEGDGMAALGLRVINNEYNLPWSHFVGACGMTGQTAYYGLKEPTKAKAGETLFVAAASGAVGQMVVQLAKLQGLKVIATAGSDEKVALVKSLGADHVFNYKTSDVNAELQKHGPVNIYFDLVGGEILDAAIANCAQQARILICGSVSQYNQDPSARHGIKNMWLTHRTRTTIYGYIVIDWESQYLKEFTAAMPKLISDGKVKVVEHVYRGLAHTGQGLLDMLTGKCVGKAVVVLADN